jgi:Fe-S oxidoreductase
MPMANVCCGLTWHSTGQLDMTKKVLSQTLRTMQPLIDADYPVIGLEPSCTIMLQHEATDLLPDDPRARRLGELTRTFGQFVAEHLEQGKPWPFGQLYQRGEPAAAICQIHCHQKSTTGYGDELRVLEKLNVATDVVGGGCCGLAGNWGFEPGHYEVSQVLGERELFPKVRSASEETLVLADGFSCRTQLEQGTGVRGIHLAQILHSALVSARTEM